MQKKIIKSILILLVAINFNGNAQEKFVKTDAFMQAERNTVFGWFHKKIHFNYMDYSPGNNMQEPSDIKKSKGMKYAYSLLSNHDECEKLLKDGPNVINVENGVIIIEYCHTTGYWSLDYKKHNKAVGDESRLARFFLKNKKNKQGGSIESIVKN